MADPFAEFLDKPETVAPNDPFAQFLDQARPDVVTSASSSPDEAAQAIDLGNKLSQPPSAVLATLPDSKEELKRKQGLEAAQDPHVSTYIQGHPLAAQVSNDDLPTLAGISKKISDMLTGLGNEPDPFGISRNKADWSQVWGAIKEAYDQPTLSKDLQRIQDNKITEGLITNPLTGVPIRALGIAKHSMQTVSTAIGAVGEALTYEYGVPMPGLGKDLKLAAEANLAGQGLIRGPLPRGVIELNTLARDAAQMSSKAELDSFMKAAGQGKSRTADEIAEFIRRRDAGEVWNDALGKFETDLEFSERTKPRPAEGAGESKGQVAPLEPEAQIALEKGGLPRPGADPRVDKLHEAQTRADSTRLDQAFAAVQESKTRERSPEMMSQFLGNVVGDKVIYLPADKVIELYNKPDAKPPGPDDGALGYVPNITEQVEHAMETGGDVAIPLKDFLARTDPSVYDEVKDSIRFRPEGLTLEEAKLLVEQRAAEVAAQTKKPKRELIGESLPERGLAPANLGTDNKIYVGKPDTLHFMLSEKYSDKIRSELKLEPGVGTWQREGFITPTGEFLNRMEAYDWVVKNEKANIKPSENMADNLDAADYREQVPLQKRRDAEGYRLETQAQGQAEKAKRALYLHDSFENGKALGMTEANFARFAKKIEKADVDLVNKALAAREREVKRPETEAWKADEAEIRQEVETDFRSRPDLAVDTYLRTGKLPSGEEGTRVYLDSAAVERVLGPDNHLKDVSKEGGKSPDDVAEAFGYNTGAEMLRDQELIRIAREQLGETPTKYHNRIVDQEVQVRMNLKYGSLEARIWDAVQDALVSADRLDIVSDELKAIATQAGFELPFTKEFLQGYAENRFGQLIAEQASFESGRRAAEAAGRKAETALLKGDYAEAFKEKQRQFQAMLYAREARAFEKEKAKGDRLIDSMKSREIKGVSPAYADQIHGVLERLGVRTRRNRDELAAGLAGTDLRSFVEAGAANGLEFSIPEYLLDTLNTKKIEDLTVDEYRQLIEALGTLKHNGEQEKFITVNGEKVLFALNKAEMIANLEKNPYRSDLAKPGKKGKPNLGKKRYGWDSELLRMEMLAEDIDYGDSTGPFSRSVFQRAKDAHFAETALEEKIIQRLKTLKSDKEFRDGLNDKIPNDFLVDPHKQGGFYDLTRENLLWIAANFGNRSNINKIVNGSLTTRGLMDQAVQEMKFRKLLNENMRKSDWEFVQGIWDIFSEETQPLADAMYRRLTGIGMTPIKAEAIKTPHGTFKGGYFPLIYDQTRSNIEQIKEGNPLETYYARATSPNGYMKARMEGFYDHIQIQQTTDMFLARLKQEIHDIAYREAVIDINKIFQDPEIRQAITTRIGPEYSRQLMPWLRDVANKQNVNTDSIAYITQFMSKVRRNVLVQALGFNANVFLSPAVGKLFNSPAYMATAGRMIANPRQAAREINEAMAKSPELRETMLNLDRDLRDQLTFIMDQSWMDWATKGAAYASMLPARATETLTRSITFLTEYRQRIADGVPEAEAITQAEREVRRWHGATSKVDLPAFFRQDNEAVKWITMFQSFMNTMYNQEHMVKNEFRRAEGFDDYINASSNAWAAVITPILFSAALFTERKKDESLGSFWARAIALSVAGTLPFANQLGQIFLEGNRPTDPVTKAGQEVYKAYRNSTAGVRHEAMSKTWLQNILNLGGVLKGLPTGQIARTTQFLYDVRTRKQNPRTFGQFIHGLRTGRAEEGK